LARYTHRVAISNSRLLSLENGRVTFEWKDYAHGNQIKPMTLDAAEFMRRFLLHVLPPGFVRIRQFGFLANRVRKQKLALCRSLLGTLPPDQSARTDSPADGNCKTEQQPRHCPACKAGWLVAIGVFRPGEMVSLEAVAPVTRAGSPGHLMTVPLTNLLPNSAAFSAGTGDLCPDSKLRAPECQCRSLKRALPVAHSPLLACRHFHYQQPALPAPSRQFEKPFKPHK